MTEHFQITIKSGREGPQTGGPTSPGPTSKLKRTLAAILFASAAVGLLIVALVLGSLIAVFVWILLVVGSVILIFKSAFRTPHHR